MAAVKPAVVDSSTETPPTVIVPPVNVVAEAVKSIPVVIFVTEGVSGILSVAAHTIFTIPSPKSVACLNMPLAEKSFNCVETREDISAVVLFCGSAELAVKVIQMMQ